MSLYTAYFLGFCTAILWIGVCAMIDKFDDWLTSRKEKRREQDVHRM